MKISTVSLNSTIKTNQAKITAAKVTVADKANEAEAQKKKLTTNAYAVELSVNNLVTNK